MIQKKLPLVNVYYRRKNGFIRGFLEASDEMACRQSAEALERLFVAALKRHVSVAHYPLIVFSHIPCECKGRYMLQRIAAAIRKAGFAVETRMIP